jgi:hypothetical protein
LSSKTILRQKCVTTMLHEGNFHMQRVIAKKMVIHNLTCCKYQVYNIKWKVFKKGKNSSTFGSSSKWEDVPHSIFKCMTWNKIV